MTELGWSVEDLAAKADISPGTVHNALAGKSIYRKTVAAMANALGVEAAVLLYGTRKAADVGDIHEYRVEEVLADWVEASNGLRFQICKMRHTELDRWARGKRYDLRKMSSEDEQRCRGWFKRHPDVCYALRDHPNIVRNITAFRAPAGDFWWIIDEWLDATTLHDRLKRGPLGGKGARSLMLGVAEGLSALHSAGFIRRELNPCSILVSTKDGTAILTEFELAKLCDGGVTVSSDEWPTDPYRAPEAESDDVDVRADLYSWARVSLHALVGELPAIGDDMGIVEGSGLPKPVVNVVRQSLSISRRKRPADFSAVIAALKKWKV
jgi:serine/threonine protein kinase